MYFYSSLYFSCHGPSNCIDNRDEIHNGRKRQEITNPAEEVNDTGDQGDDNYRIREACLFNVKEGHLRGSRDLAKASAGHHFRGEQQRDATY